MSMTLRLTHDQGLPFREYGIFPWRNFARTAPLALTVPRALSPAVKLNLKIKPCGFLQRFRGGTVVASIENPDVAIGDRWNACAVRRQW